MTEGGDHIRGSRHLQSTRHGADREQDRPTAPARLDDVWIVEDKLCREPVLLPVHLGANDAEEGLAVDEDLNAVLLDTLVKLARLARLDVLEMVAHASTALVADSNSDQAAARVE